MSQVGCPYEPKLIVGATRKYPIDQKYMSHGKKRANNKMTRSIDIALEEHRQWHIENETFATLEQLERHQQLMLDGMLGGMDFNQAHLFALENI